MKIFKQDIWYFFNDDGEDRRREKMMKIISGYYRRLLAHSQQRCDFYAKQDSEYFDASERSQLTVMTRLIWGTGTCAAAAIVKDKIVIGMNQKITSDDLLRDGTFACFRRLCRLTFEAYLMDAGLEDFLENINNSMSKEDVLSSSTKTIKDECVGLINAAYDSTRKRGESGNALLIGDYNNDAGQKQLNLNKKKIMRIVDAFDLLKGVKGLYERLDDFQAKMIAEKYNKVVVDWVLPFLRDFSVWVEWARFGQGPVVSKIIATQSAQFVDDKGIACDLRPDFDENHVANLKQSLKVSLRTDAMIMKVLSNHGEGDLEWLNLLRSLVVGDEYDWDTISDKPIDLSDSVVPGVLAAFNWLKHERDQFSGDVNKVDFDEITLKLSDLVSVAVDRLMLRLSLDHILYHNNYQKNKKAKFKSVVDKDFLKFCLIHSPDLYDHSKNNLRDLLSEVIQSLQNNVVSDSDKQNLFSWAVEFMKNLHGLVNAVWHDKRVVSQIMSRYQFLQDQEAGNYPASLESFGSGDVHAEMKVVQHMMREQALSPLGVSKLCCPHCYAFIASLDPAGKTQCIGHHTKAFHTKLPWQVITDIGRSRYDYQNALLPADVIKTYKDLSKLERSGEGVITLRSGQRINVLDFLHIVIEAMPHLHHPRDRLAQMVTGLTESSLNVLFKSSTGSSLPSHGDAKYMLPDTHLFMNRKLWFHKQDFFNRIRSKKIDHVAFFNHSEGYADLTCHGCTYNVVMNGPNQYVGFHLIIKGNVIKVVHNNPCGGRIGDNLLEALEGYAKKMGYYLQLTDLMIRQTLNCFESATWVVSNATKMLWILNADESKLLDLSVTDMFAADMVMGAAYDHHVAQPGGGHCVKMGVTSCDVSL